MFGSSEEPINIKLANFTVDGDCEVFRLRGVKQLDVGRFKGGVLEVLSEPYLIPNFGWAVIGLIMLAMCVFPIYVFCHECRGGKRKVSNRHKKGGLKKSQSLRVSSTKSVNENPNDSGIELLRAKG